MNEQEFSGRTAQPERYINRLSSTVVVLFKLFDGAIAGFVLYSLFRLLAPVFAELTKGALDINHVLQLFSSEYGISQLPTNELIGGVALPFIVWIGTIIVIIIHFLLVVIEALALLVLRIIKKGAAFIKVIHQIYMGVCLINLVFFGIYAYQYYRKLNAMQSDTRLSIPTLIFAVICLISLLLSFCYHKDIAMAMDTVAYETATGNLGKLRRTHLSGISFIFSLPYFLLILLIAAALYGSF